ncbi:UDP-N-acetylmuramoyl-L-alanyl-D-glutamate--2,6-diaminopimelate ligase, partial [Patescibacteria group bacterium]|nr:UDP-N-acetylmuramoyl-L-alanyl-D-glutamate--2,6-diaminopimelate ligase [Patescibacteria group bacterium]
MNIKSFFPQKIKNIYHLGQAILANFVYGFPGRKIHPVKSAESGPASQEFNGVKIIGVTGTNGKTTTVWMIGKILEEAGFKVAINSTINFQIGDKKWVNKTKFTTLSSFAVQKFIKEAVQEKCDYLVLETSSHSLDQFRVWGIPYIVAVITNVTREHLDYHQTMEEYRKAKLKLLQKAETIVVNSDMEKPEYYLDCNTKEKYSYSVKSTNHNVQNTNKIQNPKSKIQKVVAENIELGINYSNYKLLTTNYKLNLPGLFNIENALAATCVGLSQGINLETIKSALEKIKNIPGRMEYVLNDKNLNIIIDYAVTPDSLEKLYKLIKTINTKHKKIIAVFGSCGERDRGKRPIMGEIVARYADYIFVTNEDPYNEDPIQIINEVFSGIAGFEVKGELLKSQISNL